MKYVNTCTYPIDLNDGRTLEPGGVLDLDIDPENNVHDNAYVVRGVLAEVVEVKPEDESSDGKNQRGGKTR